MLQRVLQAVEESTGPVRLQELSRRLGIEPATLDGMLEFWVSKGRIRKQTGEYAVCEQPSCEEPGCHAGCRSCGVRLKRSVRRKGS